MSDHIILVTGATGHQGGAVAHELLQNGYKVKAMTRKPDSVPAKELKELGADVVYGDLNDADSLRKVLKGVWGVFAVQNSWEAGVEVEEEQGKRLAELAKEVGVHHYVYTSVQSANRKTGIPHFDNKYRIEDRIKSLGFPSYTIIRPVFFMENFVMSFKSGLDYGKLTVTLSPETKLQMIAVADIGKVGLLAFAQHEKYNGAAIDIAGDELSMPETAAIISKYSGKQIVFEPTPIEQVRQYSNDFAIMLEWFDKVGYNVDIEGTSKSTGVRFTGLDEWASGTNWAS